MTCFAHGLVLSTVAVAVLKAKPEIVRFLEVGDRGILGS